jgi:hypothetical protein
MSSSHPTPKPTQAYLDNTVENETPKVFRVIDPPRDAPLEVQERTRIFVAKVDWTFSTTMRQWPHEYLVRARMPGWLRQDYDQLFRDIVEHGWRGRFLRKQNRYLTVDGWRFWSCLLECGPEHTNRPCAHRRYEVGCVINRALNDDLPAVQLELG